MSSGLLRRLDIRQSDVRRQTGRRETISSAPLPSPLSTLHSPLDRTSHCETSGNHDYPSEVSRLKSHRLLLCQSVASPLSTLHSAKRGLMSHV